MIWMEMANSIIMIWKWFAPKAEQGMSGVRKIDDKEVASVQYEDNVLSAAPYFTFALYGW